MSIYDKISEYIIVLNVKGEVVFCNKSFLNRFNYKGDEILNRNIVEITNNFDYLSNLSENINDINEVLELYTKANEIIKISASIGVEDFNNKKSIVIVGKELDSKIYNMEMLEELLDNIDIATFIIDKNGKYLYVNNNFSEILNKKKKDIIGTYNSDHWDDKDYNNFDKNNNEVLESKNAKIFNEKCIINGKESWYKSYKSPIFDEYGNAKYVVATTKNVNLPKTVSEELYKHYNKANMHDNLEVKSADIELNKILSNISQYILEYTKSDGLSLLLYDDKIEGLKPIINLNQSALNIKENEFISLKKVDLQSGKYKGSSNSMFYKDKLPSILNENNLLLEELNYFGNYSIRLFDEFIGVIGLSYNNNNYPRFNCDEYMKYICSKIAMLIKNARLSKKVYIENKKRKYTERELERYLNVSADLVAIVGKDGYIKKLNPNWSNVLGWSEEELLSMKIEGIVHPEELENLKEKELKNLDYIDGKVTTNIIRYRHKNGKYIYLEWNSEYFSSEEIYVTTARDITKRLEIENKNKVLEEVVKLESAKNEFFANISHEFRTPINILLGTTQVIDKNIEKNNIQMGSLKKYSNYIRQNAYRLLRLVNNLIDINKMDMGAYDLRCSNENIINIIEDITLSVAEYTKNNKINLIFDTDEEEIITYCDPDKIERIMLNILSNAIKYTPENGSIEVKINSTSKDVTVSVKDSGMGIPSEKLDIIFNRFEQVDQLFDRKCEGSGIGLSIVKNLVQMHGGDINVYSKLGEGSEFIFNIPIKLKQEYKNKLYDGDRKIKHVERCNIEFSDIYSA
ncbi:PAS domain S-box protein [Terrisporobacter sp.]